MSATIIPFPRKPRAPRAPQFMWRVEGGGVALLIEDVREAVSFLADGWERVVMVEVEPGRAPVNVPTMAPRVPLSGQ